MWKWWNGWNIISIKKISHCYLLRMTAISWMQYTAESIELDGSTLYEYKGDYENYLEKKAARIRK